VPPMRIHETFHDFFYLATNVRRHMAIPLYGPMI
jgi:hypothetical protein